MNSGNIYSVGDKGIYDALNQTKVTKTDLKELFLSRGIVISPDTSRKDLAIYFSRMLHDYYDYQKLASILGAHNKKDKATVSYIKVEDYDLDKASDAAVSLMDNVEDLDAKVEVNHCSNNIELVINYKEVNFNKSEFRQVIDRTSIVTVHVENGIVAIRGPLNQTVEEVKKKLRNIIGEKEEKILYLEDINMRGVTNPETRTEFFELLVKNIKGLRLKDVSDVYVYHPRNLIPDDSFDNEAEDPESESDIPEDTAGEVDLGVHITKASLKGENVLHSQELKGLYKNGFYIWRIIWHCVDESFDSDIYEFEAQFTNPEDFSGFSFLARGFYRYKGNGDYNTSRTLFSSDQERELEMKIENAAQHYIDKLGLN